MAKNTKAQEVATGTSDSYTDDEIQDPDPPVRITRAELGTVDQPWHGNNSTQSSENDETESDSQKASRRKPAPTTDNRSKRRGKATDSDAISTDGDGPKTDRPLSDDINDDEFFE